MVGYKKVTDDVPRVAHSGRSTSSYTPLPRHELLVYIAIEAAAVVFAIYSIYRDSIDRLPWMHPSFLQDGWSWLGRKQDIADFEWTFWYKTLWQLLPWYAAHFVMGKLLEQIAPKLRNLSYLVFTLVYLFQMFGWKILLLFVAHGCIMFLGTNSGSSAVVWAISIGLMCTTSFDQPRIFINSLMKPTRNQEETIYVIIGELVRVNLKYTSFCLEKVRSQRTSSNRKFEKNYKAHTGISSHCLGTEEAQLPLDDSDRSGISKSLKPSDHYSFVDLFQYMFYFPLFFSAPIVTYDTFRTEINERPRPCSRQTFFGAIFVFLRVAFWAFFIEFSTHYVYISALMFNPFLLQRVSRWTLMGIGYLHGQFKMVKYVVFYGLTGQLARLDGLEVPGPPSCISYIYRYSEMWKLFDKGIYNFTKRYIYIPVGGSKAGLSRKLFGSFLCFMFFYSYHGLDFYLFVWSLLNFIELVIEVCAKLIEQTESVQRFETRHLTPLWVRRIHAVCAVPLFYISIFAIFYFFGEKKTGDIFIDRNFINGNLTSFLVMYSIVYCCIQTAMEIEGRKTKVLHTKKE